MPFKYIITIFICLSCISCARAPLKNIKQALKLAKPPTQLNDDLNLKRLKTGLQQQIKQIKKSRPKKAHYTFGSKKISRDHYLLALDTLTKTLSSNLSKKQFFDYVLNNFDFYEVYGQKKPGEILVTSYFEPEIKGSLDKTLKFSQPLYAQPDNFIEIDLRAFNVCKNCPSRLIGRLQNPKSVKLKVVPHFNRTQIDQGEKLDRELILCFVDLLDAFFLQIQGSGTVKLDNGKSLRVGYAGQNGHKYVAIGNFLIDHIPLEDMSLQTIEKYLRSLPRKEIKKYLAKNPSYVFFRELEGRPITSLGSEVVDGRTIATDIRYFPKGGLGFLIFNKPIFNNTKDKEPANWQQTSRFVFDQDTGGAIKGGGRVDLFWGKGAQAKKHAGIIKSKGRLYYLAPKDAFLRSLSRD